MSTESSTTEFNRLPPAEDSAEQSSTKDVAKEQATGVASSAGQAGQHVAGVAKDQAANVASEAGRQARDMVGQARAELDQQAVQQQQRVVDGLHSIGTELSTMADRSEEPGVATDLTRQASSKAHELAEWLEQREPSGLLDEVKTFARRRPGAFLAIALGAGLAAGRLTRGLKDESTSDTPATSSAAGTSTDYAGTSNGWSTGGGRSERPTTTPGSPASAPPVTVVDPVVPPETGVEYPYAEQPYTERPEAERPYTQTSTPGQYPESTQYPESGESRP